MENLRYFIVSSLYIAMYYYWEPLGIIFQLKMFTKINIVENGYFLGKNWYFNEKSQKLENLIQHHVCRYVDDNSTCRDVWKEKLTFSCIIYIYFSFFLTTGGRWLCLTKVQFVSIFFFFDNEVIADQILFVLLY